MIRRYSGCSRQSLTSTTKTIILVVYSQISRLEHTMTEPSQADIMAAMQAGSFRSKPPSNTTLYSDISDTSSLTQEAEGSKSKTNARKIYCFREGCGSVILQKAAATYIESSSTIVSPRYLLVLSRLNYSSQMTLHPLSHLQTRPRMASGTFLTHIPLTTSDSRDPILHLPSPYQPTRQEMTAKRERGRR